MKEPMQNFITCMLLRYILPLLPLFVVYAYEKDIGLRPLVLSTSIYVITQSLASRNILTFSTSLVSGLFLMAVYGAVDKESSALPIYAAAPAYVLLFCVIAHGLERYNRHVNDCEPFFQFKTQ